MRSTRAASSGTPLDVAGRDDAALRNAAEQPREQDHHDVVAHLQRARAPRRLALARSRRSGRRSPPLTSAQRGRARAPSSSPTFARAPISSCSFGQPSKQPEVVHERERQRHAEPRQIPVPAQRAQRERRRARPHETQRERAERPGDRGVLGELGGNGHVGVLDQFPCSARQGRARGMRSLKPRLRTGCWNRAKMEQVAWRTSPRRSTTLRSSCVSKAETLNGRVSSCIPRASAGTMSRRGLAHLNRKYGDRVALAPKRARKRR